MTQKTASQIIMGRIATAGIVGGTLAGAVGFIALAVGVLQGGLPGWLVGVDAISRALAALPGFALTIIGLGLIVRGAHMHATLATLDSMRSLQGQGGTPVRPQTSRPDLRAVDTPASVAARPGLRATKAGATSPVPLRQHPIFTARPPH